MSIPKQQALFNYSETPVLPAGSSYFHGETEQAWIFPFQNLCLGMGEKLQRGEGVRLSWVSLHGFSHSGAESVHCFVVHAFQLDRT